MRTVVDLPDEQIEPLKALAQQMKLSRAELVRRAVADYLRRHRPAEKGADPIGLALQLQEDIGVRAGKGEQL